MLKLNQQICISFNSSWTNTNSNCQMTGTFFSGRNKTFPPQLKNWQNRTTVLYTKYVCNTKNYFPPEPKKITQHHNCMVLQVHSSMYNQILFPARTENWHNSTAEKKVPPAHAKRGQVPPTHVKRVCSSVSPSVSLCVRAKRGDRVKEY